MTNIVTAKQEQTRFFLTDEGMASDIPSRAKAFNHSHDAQHAANLENLDSLRWYGIKWEAAQMLHNGAIATQ